MQIQLNEPPPACRAFTLSHPADAVATATKTKPARRRDRSRTAILTFAIATLAINFAVLIFLEKVQPGLRDPEYSRRITHLRARVAENPERPLVLVVGSSRTAMGVRPGEWEANRSVWSDSADPLLFNLSLIGGGPLMELIVLQRAIADGVKPAAILLEYWPPLFWNGHDDPYGVSVDRLGPRDRAVVNEFFATPDSTGPELPENWLNPVFGARQRFLVQLLPKWIPSSSRLDWMWADVDGWGWKPGCDFKPGPSEPRTILVNQAREAFSRRFQEFRIDPHQDRAFREAISLARKSRAEVKLIYMPESTEFQGWYPPAVEQATREHFSQLAHEFGVTVIDARGWMEDGLFSDGFHLTRIGAAEFTRKLGPTIAAIIQKEKGEP